MHGSRLRFLSTHIPPSLSTQNKANFPERGQGSVGQVLRDGFGVGRYFGNNDSCRQGAEPARPCSPHPIAPVPLEPPRAAHIPPPAPPSRPSIEALGSLVDSTPSRYPPDSDIQPATSTSTSRTDSLRHDTSRTATNIALALPATPSQRRTKKWPRTAVGGGRMSPNTCAI